MRALKSDLGVMNPLRRRSWLAVTSILTVSAFAPPSRPMRCRGDMVHSRQCGHYRTVPLPYEYKMYGLKWWLQNENRLESSPQEEDVAPISTDPAAKKTKTKTTKSKKAVVTKTDDDEPTYWKMQSDEALITEESIKFTVRGKPVPLRRHRTSRGFMYNPSARNQEEFRQVVSQILPSLMMGPYFGEDDFLAINIVFHLRRPKSHFVGNKPGPGRLRPKAPGRLHSTRVDVDNLAKFVLDSLNELVFEDDRQVVFLNCAKVLDSEGCCDGATEVTINRVEEEDVEKLLYAH